MPSKPGNLGDSTKQHFSIFLILFNPFSHQPPLKNVQLHGECVIMHFTFIVFQGILKLSPKSFREKAQLSCFLLTSAFVYQ